LIRMGYFFFLSRFVQDAIPRLRLSIDQKSVLVSDHAIPWLRSSIKQIPIGRVGGWLRSYIKQNIVFSLQFAKSIV